jgi:hypothetical protein
VTGPAERIWNEIHAGKKPVIEIPEAECERAHEFAAFLLDKAERYRKRNGAQNDDPLELASFVLQNMGELAFCLHRGLSWVPDPNANRRPPIDGWYVRTRKKPWHGLGIYSGHTKDGRGFVLATPCMSRSEDMRRIILHGWITTGEAFTIGAAADSYRTHRDGMLIEQDRLHPIGELP